MNRIVLFRVWIALLVVGVSGSLGVVDAQTIDLRLGLVFNDTGDDQSGGTFQLAALSGGGGGISALVTRVEGIEFNVPTTPVINAPATFGWLDPVNTSSGPVAPILDRSGGVTEILWGQDVSLDTSSLVFNIGHGVGTPGDQGADPFGLGFDNSALLATGSFAAGSTPSFSTQAGYGSAGNLFDAVDSNVAIQATVNLSVVDNLGVGPGVAGDYNANSLVEQGDLDLVLLNWGAAWPPAVAGWVNFQPTDGAIDQNDLDGVLLNWGNSAAVASAGTVPEPTSLWLLGMGMTGLLIGRSRKTA